MTRRVRAESPNLAGAMMANPRRKKMTPEMTPETPESPLTTPTVVTKIKALTEEVQAIRKMVKDQMDLPLMLEVDREMRSLQQMTHLAMLQVSRKRVNLEKEMRARGPKLR